MCCQGDTDKAKRTGFDFLVLSLKVCVIKRLRVFESDVRLLHFAILEVWGKMPGGFGFVINNSQDFLGIILVCVLEFAALSN